MNERDAASFLERWSRRKTLAREEAQPAAEPEEGALPAAEAPSLPADAETPPVELKLPDLDTLDGDSDYSAFLTPGVDTLLRRRALRKLFHSPKFNVLDGLDDYMGDFTSFEPLGDIVTADMRHQIERAARKLAQALDEPREPAPAAAAAAAPIAAPAAATDEPQPEEAPSNDEPTGTA